MVEKYRDFLQKQKSFLQNAHFGPFLAVPAQ
jgi:hypothetical protein